MPGLKDAPQIDDVQLADVATFIRHAWNNRKSAVKPETIKAVRDELADRETTFTPDELKRKYSQ